MMTHRFSLPILPLAALLALGLSACGSDDTGGTEPIKIEADGGSSGGDDTSVDDGASSSSGGDTTSSSGGDTTSSSSGAETTSSSGGTDAGADAGGGCPYSEGCECEKDGDCATGLCTGTPDGMRCAGPCTDGCTGEYECKTLTAGGRDNQNLCVHKHPTVCAPCKTNAVCSSAFDPDAKCVDRGKDGFYCGASCASNSDCPTGYACDKVKDITGAEVSQCVTDDGSICKCSKYAMAAKMSTKCADKDGCAGERTCLADGETGAPTGGGLSQCTGGTKADEKCDGIDNNCDGATDEATCDDKEPCTTDSCDPSTGACTNTPLTTGTCDDGDACTESDACAAGKCTGEAKKCDDSDACTVDSCKDGKCETAPATDAPCDDSDKCTTDDKCDDKGKCNGAAKDCDDGNKCSIDTCADGVCSSGAVQEGPCEDGDLCTTGDKCEKDGTGKLVCKAGDVKKCDDGVECTVDSCDKDKGCVTVIDDKLEKACYPGDDKFKGVGECTIGAQKCQQDGTLGACEGAALPAAKDTCGNKKDDDCDGATDDGCGAAGVVGRFGNVSAGGTSGTNTIRVFVGGGMVGGHAKSATSNSVELGFYAWVASLLK